ncbi:MAG: hypothetical protein D6740_05430 [Alphaproteobacteria bacterium]|nr:MAG: hypothetical protein D6740_05430 [Alphaproteobacteria bacterium]
MLSSSGIAGVSRETDQIGAAAQSRPRNSQAVEKMTGISQVFCRTGMTNMACWEPIWDGAIPAEG